jgi:acyl-coenzyme A synthetase/AMP-(fatty) acid ligase
MENLPRNATNKIIRREVKNMLEDAMKGNIKIKILEV